MTYKSYGTYTTYMSYVSYRSYVFYVTIIQQMSGISVRNKFFAATLLVCSFSLGFSRAVLASTTDGTIDATSKYAWGDKLGWVNFGTTGGNVHVTDSALTGYAWSQNYGWINLSPTQGGVTNNAEGDLSGFAWGENLGYIDFSAVSINAAGVFAGSASSSLAGAIKFDCSNCAVVTDWRPASSRSSASTAGSSGGNAGGPPAASYYPPRLPPGGFKVFINSGAAYTMRTNVALSFVAGSDVSHVAIDRKSVV